MRLFRAEARNGGGNKKDREAATNLFDRPVGLEDHDVEVEDELWGRLGERVEEPQHADVTLLLVEPLVVDRVPGLHRFEAGFEHHQVPG